MEPVVTAAEMRAVDAASPVPVEQLIERAGAAVARQAGRLLGGHYGRVVVVLAGPGNNGADGRVAAELLRRRGAQVHVLDARHVTSAELAAQVSLPGGCDLVIDAAFGTGFRGRWAAPEVGATPVLAVDLPTGLDADTGRAAPDVLAAACTVTFAAAKPGHLLGDGPDLVGELVVADIGLAVERASIHLLTQHDVASWLPPRRRSAHKWSHAVRLVAGSTGMTGAAQLAAAAAMRAGSGMVVASIPGCDPAPGITPIEAVWRGLPAERWGEGVLTDLHRFAALLAGPGLGRGPGVTAGIAELIRSARIPLVLDGDALWAVAELGPDRLRERPATTVLTPHDGEFELLAGALPGDDRIGDARRLAARTGTVVLLKGPTTVIADADGEVLLMPDGDQRLATAGTGDVLAGCIAALLARRLGALQAAGAGAWLHAAAARRLPGPGLVAGDLIQSIPAVLR